MPTKYKLTFTYDSKDILEKQLMSLDGFDVKNDNKYEYKKYYYSEYLVVSIEEDGLLVYTYNNYSDYKWLFRDFERMIGKNYNNLTIMNLSKNISYAFEKFAISEKWIALKILTSDDLISAYKEEFTSNNWYYIRDFKIKFMQKWFKNKKNLTDEEFELLLVTLKEIALLIRTIPLTKKQRYKLEMLSVNNNAIENELLYRKILNNDEFTNAFLYEVIKNNRSETIIELINKVNNHESLTYILEYNNLNSSKINNSIRTKLGLRKEYKNKKRREKILLLLGYMFCWHKRVL